MSQSDLGLAAVRASPSPLFVVDGPGTVVAASRALADVFGDVPVEGQVFDSLSGPFGGLAARLAADGDEVQVRAADGSVFCAEARSLGDGRLITFEPARRDDPAPQPVGDMEAADVLASFSDAFFVLDPEWRFTYVNAQAEAFVGREAGDLVGMSIWEAFPEAVGTRFESAYYRAVETGEPVLFEAFFEPLGRHFAVRASPFSRGLSVAYTDVTGLKDTEAALEASRAQAVGALGQVREVEKRLTLALEGGGLGTWEWDLATDGLRYDERMAALWGVGPDDLRTAEDFLAIVHPEDLDGLRERLAAALEVGARYEAEFRIVRPDGETRWVLARGAVSRQDPDDPSSTPVGVYGVNFDLTSRREQEETLRQKNAEMERFTYTVSHDLKSPLVTVTGFLGLLKAHLAAGRTDKAAAAADRVLGAAKRMGRLIEDLLLLSRAGQAAAEPTAVDLDALVGDLAGDLSERARAEGGEIVVEGPLGTVLADPVRMTETVENLLANAVAYGLGGGGTRVTVRAGRAGRGWRLIVEDDGPGVPEAYRERVFGLFQRLATDGTGTGVGLAVVARVMEVMGGSACVESAGGPEGREGARFVLTFPAPAVLTSASATGVPDPGQADAAERPQDAPAG